MFFGFLFAGGGLVIFLLFDDYVVKHWDEWIAKDEEASRRRRER
jgi:hypothetical protein